MDKRTIIIVVILGILVIFWIPIMTKLGFIEPPKQQPVADTAMVATQVDTTEPISQPPTEPIAATRQSQEPQQISDTTSDTAAVVPEKTITIETNVQKFVMSNHGGAPISILLKDYKYENGKPIEMLPESNKATPELHFNNNDVDANKFIYTASQQSPSHSVTSGTYEITYTYEKPGVGSIVKRYRFYADKHHFDLIISVNNRPGFGYERLYSLEWNNQLDPTELNIKDDYNSMWAMAMQADRVKFNDYEDDKFSITSEGITYWTATRSKYFTAILIPKSKYASGVKASGVKIKKGEYTARHLKTGLIMELPYEQNLVDSFVVYAGPMDYDALKGFDNNVTDLMDIGTTPFIGWLIKIFAIPIMWLLPRMYAIIPNYGLVIIIFAFAVKLITWPLTRKTVQSMNAMREIQPKMKELQEKHKNNPQALNKEMMKLYKEAGVNPLSGCLPYLPQMPLFFALFAVFRSTILLRQAPFMLWWTDLSRGAMSWTDPYIILVIIMVALMFLQQRVTTMTGPQQNKALMYIFPLMLGFFFYKVSAGLILYWTMFSLFSFLEQIVFKKNKASSDAASSGSIEVKKA